MQWNDLSTLAYGIIQQHRWLIDAHLVSFFVDRDQGKHSDSDEIVSHLLDAICRSKHLELLRAIPRGLTDISKPDSDICEREWSHDLLEFLGMIRSAAIPDLVSPNLTMEIADCFRQKSGMWNILRVGMSAKKQLEVQSMAKVVSDLAKSANTTYCVDLGAGQGYLSHTLSLMFGLKVVAVEASSVQVREFETKWSKLSERFRAEVEAYGSFCGAVRFELDTSSSDLESTFKQLNSLLYDKFKREFDIDMDKEFKFIICGLHTCGDLAPFMLRWAKSSENIVGVCNVGCCYNLLTESGPDYTDPRYVAMMKDTLSGDGDAAVGWGDEVFSASGEGSGSATASDVDNWTRNGQYSTPRRPIQIDMGKTESKTRISGFPMHLNANDYKLGSRARSLACLSVLRWGSDIVHSESDDTCPFTSPTLEKDYWRALLQKALYNRIGLAAERIVVGKIRRKNFDLSLAEYIDHCLKSANPRHLIEKIRDSTSSSKQTEAECKCTYNEFIGEVLELESKYKGDKTRFLASWALRSSLSSAIESLIVYDRAMYLALAHHSKDGHDYGHGSPFNVNLVPICRPIDSPRNIGIVGLRVHEIEEKI